jgi:hypothetical protein
LRLVQQDLGDRLGTQMDMTIGARRESSCRCSDVTVADAWIVAVAWRGVVGGSSPVSEV